MARRPAAASSRQPTRVDPPLFERVPPGPPQPLAVRLRARLLADWLGRLLLAALAVRVALVPFELAGVEHALVDGLRRLATLVLLGLAAYGGARLWLIAQRHLLWRVRRRLVLSYVLMGLVPVLLVGLFFVFAGFLFVMNVGAYLVLHSLDERVTGASQLSRSVAAELASGRAPDPSAVLAQRVAANDDRYPGLSMAVVRVPPAAGRAAGPSPAADPAGTWAHAAPPASVPAHVVEARHYAERMPLAEAAGRPAALVARSATCAPEAAPAFCVVVDVPLGEETEAQLQREIGIHLEDPDPAPGDGAFLLSRDAAGRFPWSTLFTYGDWASGESLSHEVHFRARPLDIYERLAAARWVGSEWTFSQVLFFLLVMVAVLFLVIYSVAFLLGFSLARSITGAIHQLFTATQRIQQNDFTHRIEVTTRDQLGELALSFNAMTSSIQHLLREQAEKQRMQEELRIARDIQASLLPRGPLNRPGVSMAAMCVPAREVGGDYYDVFPLDDHRLGLLIADVSGKGTSAALYMAELKGLVLSLSKSCPSPKQLLVEVNRILSENLDSRSFITMTYGVFDLSRRTLTHARAGHTPLIHLPACAARAQVLTPPGLVVGLRLDGIAAIFEQLLEEVTTPLGDGDLFVFFTDGITEAMNGGADLFGEHRLCALVEAHGHLSTDELSERIQLEVARWVGGVDQHDDMTMILLKVG